MYDIIAKKRDCMKLQRAEIEFVIEGYISGKITDYQVSALLMAIYLNGMDAEETAVLTMAMAQSGKMIDLSGIPGIKVDKHSTGGVGDKTTLIISSIVASLGVKVAKMSGRGLGHTGGTIDKIEAIPGLKTDINKEDFLKIVNEIGLSVVGQSGNLVPADKKLYALRDVTATVECIPLIASSIMSKKIAAGADKILLDVKVGSGAFMKTIADAEELAQIMVEIGENLGRKTIALITDMDRPLGNAIGNSLELIEVCDTLNGSGPQDLYLICVELAANMLLLAELGDLETCKSLAKNAIQSGKAFTKLKEMVKAQGGDISVLEDTNKFKKAKCARQVLAPSDGFIFAMDTYKLGIASVILGAGRNTKESQIDYSAGIILAKKTGEPVKAGEKIATLYSKDDAMRKEAEKILLAATTISKTEPEKATLIQKRISI